MFDLVGIPAIPQHMRNSLQMCDGIVFFQNFYFMITLWFSLVLRPCSVQSHYLESLCFPDFLPTRGITGMLQRSMGNSTMNLRQHMDFPDGISEQMHSIYGPPSSSHLIINQNTFKQIHVNLQPPRRFPFHKNLCQNISFGRKLFFNVFVSKATTVFIWNLNQTKFMCSTKCG